MLRLKRRLTAPLLLFLACCAVVWLLNHFRPVVYERLELAAFDHLQSRVNIPNFRESVVAVIATDRSLDEVGRWPLPRRVHAKTLGQLALAKTVAVDMLFPETSTDDDDQLLAKTVAAMGNVVASIHIAADSGSGESKLVLPYRELAESAAALGFTNVRPDPDGIHRNAYFFWLGDEMFVPSLPMAAWMAMRNGAPEIEQDEDGFRIGLAGKTVHAAGDPVFKVHHPAVEIPIYEYADVHAGRVDPETFRDALVFVGVSAAGTDDFFPIGREVPLAGVLFNAHAAMTLLHGWIPVRAPLWAMLLAGFAMAGLGVWLGYGLGGTRSWIGLAAALAAWGAVAAAIFFRNAVWLPPALPALVCLAGFMVASRIQLREVADKLAVRRFSVDENLFLGSPGFDPGKTSFARYLTENWDEIAGKWSGLRLVAPSEGPSHPEVRACLSRAYEGDVPGQAELGAQAAMVSLPGGEKRLLLRHPDWDGMTERRYTVLAWRGVRELDELKSVAVLVLSAAAHFRAVEEGMAKRELFLGVIRLIMRAVDAKDPTTAGHSERVAILARELAEKLGLTPTEADDIYLSGLLHDVGKIGIPDGILNFPGKLSDEDMEVMRKHPALGLEMMNSIKLPDTVLKGIVEHHERPDGAGYPHGLGADGLSLAGKILKVADVFDALRSRRQYKEPMKEEVVYRILMEGMGKEFDRKIIAALREHPFTDLYKDDHETELRRRY